MNKIYLTLISLFFIVTNTFADKVEFTASSPKVVAVGEQFRLTFSFNAKGTAFKAPDLRDFNILSGPNTSSSSSIQIINGNMTRSVSYTYTYILSVAKQGKFTISSAQIKYKGKVYESNSISIEVVKGSAKAQNANRGYNQGRSNQIQKSNIPASEISNKDLFVRVNVNKKSLYQGEHLIATIKVYTHLNLAGFEDMKLPSFDGFWTQDIATSSQISLERENINGQIYNVGVIKKEILFPQRSGVIKIDPFELECAIRQRVRSSQSVFDDFFGSSYQTIKKKVKSKSVKITVKPLPKLNQPDDFAGAVGDFKMQTSIDKKNAVTNDAVTLKIVISGNGNLKLIDPLKINFPPDFDVYDPKITNNIKNSNVGSTGRKTFEYLIIPRHAGEFKIPPFSFSFFNTKTKRYKTLVSREYNINVKKGNEEQTTNVVTGYSKEDVKYIGSDIRFIKTDNFKLHKKGEYIFGSMFFALTYFIAILIFVVIMLIRRKHIKQNQNISLLKNKKANKISKKRLKVANSYLKQNKKENFFDEVLKALWGYLSDKLNIPVSELSKDNVIAILQQRGVDNDLIDKFIDLLNTCEYARFAPTTIETQMDKIYADASNIISKLEQKIKKIKDKSLMFKV